MKKITQNFLLISLLANIISIPLFADNTNSTNPTGELILQAKDIVMRPAPGFPAGAEIAIIRGDLSKAEPYTLRLKLPDNYLIPSHWHTNAEQVTVLSGTLNTGMGDMVDKTKAIPLTAGGYELIPPKGHHWVSSTGETLIQLDGMGPRDTTFVNPEEWKALIKKSSSKNTSSGY